MLRAGTQVWLMIPFGIITIPSGLFLWHGLGRHFGLGPNADQIEPRGGYLCACLLLVTVLVEMALSGQ